MGQLSSDCNAFRLFPYLHRCKLAKLDLLSSFMFWSYNYFDHADSSGLWDVYLSTSHKVKCFSEKPDFRNPHFRNPQCNLNLLPGFRIGFLLIVNLYILYKNHTHVPSFPFVSVLGFFTWFNFVETTLLFDLPAIMNSNSATGRRFIRSGTEPDFRFAFDEKNYSDRVLMIEISPDFPELKTSHEECFSIVVDWARKLKRRREEINRRGNGLLFWILIYRVYLYFSHFWCLERKRIKKWLFFECLIRALYFKIFRVLVFCYHPITEKIIFFPHRFLLLAEQMSKQSD